MEPEHGEARDQQSKQVWGGSSHRKLDSAAVGGAGPTRSTAHSTSSTAPGGGGGAAPRTLEAAATPEGGVAQAPASCNSSEGCPFPRQRRAYTKGRPRDAPRRRRGPRRQDPTAARCAGRHGVARWGRPQWNDSATDSDDVTHSAPRTSACLVEFERA